MLRLSRVLLLQAASLVVGGVAGWSAGCSGSTSSDGLTDGGKVPLGEGGVPAQCTPCITSATCGAGVCAQFQGDIFCAPSCQATEGVTGTCPSGTTCSIETSFSGAQVSVCVPDNSACGTAVGPGSPGSCVPSSGSSTCDGYAAPSTTAACHSCSSSSSTTCQPNGCYGGWYCDTSTNRCQSQPATCAGSGSGATVCPDAGSTTGSGTGGGSTPTSVSGSVTASGGSVSSLLFAITGDTRPANVDDTSSYPTTIIDTIFSDITARSPQPSFVVSTGDYQFSTAPPKSGQTSTSAPQIALYMSARAKFPGPWVPAMGNHECNGYTASNCGSGNSDGVTENYSNFLSTMLGPLSQTLPYYVIKINATDGSWTSKFVFIAANAWDSTQSSWLSSTLAETTTYTFVMRHEANEANTAPGTTPSEDIVTKYPVTLEICGHTHTYSHSGNRIVMGNGGAPITGSGNYGYGIVAQRSDGAIVVDEFDYQSNAADSSFHFVVTPTGTQTQ